jgi:hypothetical protein
MTENFPITDEFQKFGQTGFEAYSRSFGELNKGFQAIAAEWTEYSKKVFEDSTKAFEKIIGAKSFEDAVEIQSKFVKKSYDAHIAEMTKLGEMYTSLMQTTFKS